MDSGMMKANAGKRTKGTTPPIYNMLAHPNLEMSCAASTPPSTDPRRHKSNRLRVQPVNHGHQGAETDDGRLERRYWCGIEGTVKPARNRHARNLQLQFPCYLVTLADETARRQGGFSPIWLPIAAWVEETLLARSPTYLVGSEKSIKGELSMNREAGFGVWHLVCAAMSCYPAYGSAQTSTQMSPSAPVTASAAGSQAPQSQSDTSIEEIVVTAQRRRENLQDVPITVQAFSAQALESSVVTNAADLARVVPGMTMPTSAGYTLPHLRGVGITAIGPGIENSVALYVDGVYRGSSSSDAIALNNIAGVEVEKGPQGTLFGRNATGGLIQVSTKDPKVGPFGGAADLSYATYQTTSRDLYLPSASEPIT